MQERPSPSTVGQVLLSAGLTFAYTAVPDHLDRRRDQQVVRAGLLGVAVATSLLELRRERRVGQPESAPDDEPQADPQARVPWTWWAGIAAVGIPAAVAADRGADRVNRRVVEALRRRGVRRPWTWLGLAWGAATVAAEVTGRLAEVSPDVP